MSNLGSSNISSYVQIRKTFWSCYNIDSAGQYQHYYDESGITVMGLKGRGYPISN